MAKAMYPPEWIEAVSGYLALAVDRLADYCSAVCMWHNTGEKLAHTFTRFALPVVWDYCEVNPASETTGGYSGGLDWVGLYIIHALKAACKAASSQIMQQSAMLQYNSTKDIILTDPPYYDAIPYSDAMDFFYVWLRRTLYGLSHDLDQIFQQPLSPKWDQNKQDGELIDDSSRFENDKIKSKANYEDGMFHVFENCYKSLTSEGRFVVVFAHKHPDAWETLVSAMIRAGFVVTASWPIQTEMNTRMRAHGSAALASSIWLVCKKRPASTRPGWDNKVLEEMREKIVLRLRHCAGQILSGQQQGLLWRRTANTLW
ncbi:MAG: DUF1156 domain-containing protein [Candidatus Brocadiae bacterium]|nr:DUF1156 domain-containing protein [Candidatus Brocadiia bacterium]